MINKEHIDNINRYLEENDAIFRFVLEEGYNVPHMSVVPRNTAFLMTDFSKHGDCSINLSDDFVSWLIQYFREREMELKYNNMRSSFWSFD